MSSEGNLPEHLEDLPTKEKIELVDEDPVRRWGQIIIAFILIVSAISYLGYYTIFVADTEFQLALAGDMRVLITMGVGAALIIFGLGRAVGRK